MKGVIPFIFGLLVLLSSCGTTRIITSHPDADIYVNNVKKGQGRVDLKRMGPPQKSQVRAEYLGNKTETIVVKREFDFGTLILGLYSYGIGLVVGWRYPNEILIPVAMPEPQYNSESDHGYPTSPWMRPPKTWGSK